MGASAFRFEPLGPERFAIGDGPFRARGLAYVGVLRYVDERLPGGRPALFARLGAADPFRSFYDRIFLVTADYDVSPLVRLFEAVAGIERSTPEAVVQRGARWSGGHDPKSLWKRSLQGTTPAEVASRLSFAFDRYFPPSHAVALRTEDDAFEGELRKVPGCMNGLYAWSTVGFYEGALANLAAKNVRVEFASPVSDGSISGVLVEKFRFVVRWG